MSEQCDLDGCEISALAVNTKGQFACSMRHMAALEDVMVECPQCGCLFTREELEGHKCPANDENNKAAYVNTGP